MLCTGRPEGFSPSSTISGGLPTQCYFDAFVVPLPTWLYIIALGICAALFPANMAPQRRAWSRPWVPKALVGFYYFCIGVIVLMESIEIGRLAAASLGVGLLPFVYIGCAIACTMQATDGLWGRVKGFQVAGALFWVLSFCIAAAKVAAVVPFGATEFFSRINTAYPISDQVTDLAVEVPFYALLAAMEICLMFFKPSAKVESGMEPLEDGIPMKR